MRETPTPRYDVFLSHNSKDKPAVRTLGTALKKRGLSVCLDEWELQPGLPWQNALEDAGAHIRSQLSARLPQNTGL